MLLGLVWSGLDVVSFFPRPSTRSAEWIRRDTRVHRLCLQARRLTRAPAPLPCRAPATPADITGWVTAHNEIARTRGQCAGHDKGHDKSRDKGKSHRINVTGNPAGLLPSEGVEIASEAVPNFDTPSCPTARLNATICLISA